MQPTRWDLMLFARAAAMALIVFAVALLVTGATDEGGVPWLGRAARTLPLAPLCSALGVWAALAPVVVRGDALALQSLGRSPAQIGAGAVAGAALLALLVACAMGTSRAVDVTGFYPLVPHPTSWRWVAGGRLRHRRALRGLPRRRLQTPVAAPRAVPPAPPPRRPPPPAPHLVSSP